MENAKTKIGPDKDHSQKYEACRLPAFHDCLDAIQKRARNLDNGIEQYMLCIETGMHLIVSGIVMMSEDGLISQRHLKFKDAQLVLNSVLADANEELRSKIKDGA